MKHLRFLGFVLIGLVLSCEDTKKSTVVKDEIVSKIEKESLQSSRDSIEMKIDTKEDSHPIITNENVVTFLTEYGKENPENRAIITTNHGKIVIELFKNTPLHRANFVHLVKQGYFNGTFFHRIVKNFIIQGGNSDDISTPRKRNKIGRNYLLPAEIVPGRTHTYGTISGAKEYRDNPDMMSAPFEFFIFLGPQSSTSHLNGNYTIFGKVITGMNIVEKIANLPSEEGDWPVQNVYIQEIILQ